jgi:hypothetical protein
MPVAGVGQGSFGGKLGFLLVSLGIAPMTAVYGQSALWSAAGVDETLAAQANAPVPSNTGLPHLGPVQLSLGALAGATYTDNVNYTQFNPESDVLLNLGADLGLYWAARERSQLQLQASLGYVWYLHEQQNNGFQVIPTSILSYSASLDEVTATVYDQFGYTREVLTQAGVVNQATLPRLENTAGVRLEWDPRQWAFQAGYSRYDYVSSQNSANAFLNRYADYYFGRAGWRFAEHTEAGVEASGAITRYRVATQNNNSSLSLGGYADWQLRPSLSLSLRGGPILYVFDSNANTAGGSTLNSYYLGFDANHQLTDHLSQHLDVQHSVQAGQNQGSAYVEQLSVNYTLNEALTDHLTVGLTLTYENGRQPLPVTVGPFVFETIEHFDRYAASPQLSWRCTEKLTATLTYSYWLRNSDLPDRGYTINTVSLNLDYRF